MSDMNFTVTEYKGVPILPDGIKRKQKRDANGRFIRGFDYIPDPDYNPESARYLLGHCYTISFVKPRKAGTVREINEAHQNNKQ